MNDAAENTIACAQARDQFDDLVERAAKHKERLVLTRRGKPVAAILPIEDLNFLEAIEDQLGAEEFQRAKEEFERSGEPAIPWAKVKAELGLRA
jgi:prevent-host-death family protein